MSRTAEHRDKVIGVTAEDLIHRAEVLQRVIESMNSGLALEPLLAKILESAIELIAADDGTIGLVLERAHGPVVRTIAAHQMPAREVGSEMPEGIGLAGRVLLEKQPVHLARYGDLGQTPLPELDEHAVIGAPIWWGGEMIGFFGIGARPPRSFDEHDVDTLELFASYAAIAIRNAQAFEAEQRRTARITIVSRIGRLINSSLSLRQILQTAVEAIDEGLNYPSVALLMVDPEDPQTLVLSARGGLYARQVKGEYRQSMEEGIIGNAARRRQPVLISDVRSDPNYIPIPGAEDILSELAIPVIAGGRLLGVLNIESEQLIPEEDAEAFKIIADQLGVAIANAYRYGDEKRRTERLRLIARIGQRITARLDPDELFAAIAEELHKRLGYDHVSLFLVDPDQPDWLVQRARASRWPRQGGRAYRQSIHQGIVGAAARNRTPERVDDLQADSRFIPVPGSAELRAELAVPIMLGERLLGVLDVAGVRRFRDEDLTSIQIVADQLAVAMDNAHLFAATQLALDETRLLYETSQRISVALDMDEVVVAYLEQVAARGHYACNVVMYEFDGTGQRTAVLILGRWTPQEGLEHMVARYPYQRDALDPLLDEGQTVTISDVFNDPRVTPELRELQEQDQRPALAMIPLMVRGHRTGLVVLSSPSVHEWSEADLKPYQATAAQLALALESRRQQLLLVESGQQLAVLEERQRLSRELHDSVTQLIFSTTLIAQSISPAWNRDPAEGERRVARLLELSQAALREMRALLFEMRPPADLSPGAPTSTGTAGPLPAAQLAGLELVRRSGLVEALRKLAAGLEGDGLNVLVEAPAGKGPDIETRRLPARHEEALYRIAQEALHNIVKHAGARNAAVRIETGEDFVRLAIQDDGKGFDPVQAATPGRLPDQTGGLGLKTMRERAEGLGGRLAIHSAPGQGATIEAVAPLQEGKR